MTENDFPIGQQVRLPGHFGEPVVLEAVRQIGSGYECRVRLLDGTPDEAILSAAEAEALAGRKGANTAKVAVARRLLTIAYRVLKEQRDYRPGMTLQRTSAGLGTA